MIKRKNPIEEATCPHCNSVFEYEESDLESVSEGLGFYCPECGEEIVIRKVNRMTFPDSFFHFGNGVKQTNRDIQEYVDNVCSGLRKSEEQYDYTMAGSGNTMVFGFKHDDGIAVYVAKDYWEDNVEN